MRQDCARSGGTGNVKVKGTTFDCVFSRLALMIFCLAGVAYILTEEAGITDCIVIEVCRSYFAFSCPSCLDKRG